MSLGPGIPAALRPAAQESTHPHRIPAGFAALPFSADSTMNIGSSKSLREPRMDLISAQHRWYGYCPLGGGDIVFHEGSPAILAQQLGDIAAEHLGFRLRP